MEKWLFHHYLRNSWIWLLSVPVGSAWIFLGPLCILSLHIVTKLLPRVHHLTNLLFLAHPWQKQIHLWPINLLNRSLSSRGRRRVCSEDSIIPVDYMANHSSCSKEDISFYSRNHTYYDKQIRLRTRRFLYFQQIGRCAPILLYHSATFPYSSHDPFAKFLFLRTFRPVAVTMPADRCLSVLLSWN
jgi:hypothetical protein